jgi:hypothetical protein
VVSISGHDATLPMRMWTCARVGCGRPEGPWKRSPGSRLLMRVNIGLATKLRVCRSRRDLLKVAPHFSVGLASPGVSVPPGTIDQIEIGRHYTTLKYNVLTIWNGQLNYDCGAHIFLVLRLSFMLTLLRLG